MDFGYAIQVLREKLADDSYELTLAVEQKDEEIQERQKERLAILQDAMNALAKPSIVPQVNELLPHVSNRALLRVEPAYDGGETSVTTYKLVIKTTKL